MIYEPMDLYPRDPLSCDAPEIWHSPVHLGLRGCVTIWYQCIEDNLDIGWY